MGDVLSLIEKAERSVDKEKAVEVGNEAISCGHRNSPNLQVSTPAPAADGGP